MRWERLFADLEGQIADDELIDRDALVGELVDEGWAQTSWRDLLGGHVHVDVLGAGDVRGQVNAVSEHILHLEAAGVDHFISVDAVKAVLSAERRAVATAGAQGHLKWVLVQSDSARRRAGYGGPLRRGASDRAYRERRA